VGAVFALAARPLAQELDAVELVGALGILEAEEAVAGALAAAVLADPLVALALLVLGRLGPQLSLGQVRDVSVKV
jgi:hypothetical protein